MSIRDKLSEETKTAMRARAADRLGTLRMISAAIKDRDIAARGEAAASPVADADLMGLLGKMIKQRQEAAKVYATGGRPELQAKELQEVSVIEEFLPQQMNATDVAAAIDAAVAEAGVASIKDMGRVMAVLKAKHAGQMDFGAVGAMIKARLG